MIKHFLSVCAIVKNEAPYIEEWIEFHLLQGVEYFYLYDNGSTDGTFEILLEYFKLGVVTILDYQFENPPQFKAYQHCLDRYRGESEWIAFIDCDEFLHTWHERWPTVASFLRAVNDWETGEPDEWANTVGIAVHWVFFGSNGETVYRPELCIERFTRRQEGCDKHVKSIVKPKFTKSVARNPHTFLFRSGSLARSEHGTPLPFDYTFPVGRSAENLRIAHFHTKTMDEYIQRKLLGDPGSGVVDSHERIVERFNAHDLNEIEDTYLRDTFAEKIKENIKNRPWHS